MGLDGIRRERERERQRKLGRKTHLGVESCVQFCRSEITASPFISTVLARKIASADCTSHGTERYIDKTERKTILYDFTSARNDRN